MKRKIRSLTEALADGGLMTVPEVAQALRVSEPSIYSWAKQGKLPFVKVGPLATRFRPEDVRQFIETGRHGVRN
jgi:excisionase family DNA binding protein